LRQVPAGSFERDLAVFKRRLDCLVRNPQQKAAFFLTVFCWRF
jgi:hypothetical protein